MTPDYDVLVVGGGMVGASLAAVLGRHVSVGVVEGAVPPPFDPAADVDLRVSALSLASQHWLTQAGAWSEIRDTRVSPFREMHVWDAGEGGGVRGELHFDSAEIGAPELGHIVENRLIQSALLARLRGLRRVELHAPARAAGLELDEAAARLALEDGRTLSARLVVGADGAASVTRQLAGIEVTGWDYGQTAVVCHVATEQPHGETARQRFLRTGPLALLPLADGRSSIVWSTTPEHAEVLRDMDAEAFGPAVGEASEHVLGEVKLASARAGFPLRAQHSREYTRQRLALVGDAAHNVHPLAGQGVNLGFLDAAALVQEITDALEAGADFGDPMVLRRYERWRKSENLAAMALLDGLKRLFGSEDRIVAGARGIGLSLVDRVTPLKLALVRRAMGLEGDLPRSLLRETR